MHDGKLARSAVSHDASKTLEMWRQVYRHMCRHVCNWQCHSIQSNAATAKPNVFALQPCLPKMQRRCLTTGSRLAYRNSDHSLLAHSLHGTRNQVSNLLLSIGRDGPHLSHCQKAIVSHAATIICGGSYASTVV